MSHGAHIDDAVWMREPLEKIIYPCSVCKTENVRTVLVCEEESGIINMIGYFCEGCSQERAVRIRRKRALGIIEEILDWECGFHRFTDLEMSEQNRLADIVSEMMKKKNA